MSGKEMIERRLNLLQWLLPLSLFGVVLLYQLGMMFIHDWLGEWAHYAMELLLYGVIGPVVVTWFTVRLFRSWLAQKEQIEEEKVKAISEERDRIARELHDGVQQDLFLLGLKVDLCCELVGSNPERVTQELKSVRQTLTEGINDLQRITRALRPIDLERLGLFEAVKKLASELGEQNRVAVQVSINGGTKKLPHDLEASLFRIVQEALSNVAKHACAKRAWVELDSSNPKKVTLTIRDDGRGFDPQMAPQGLGLKHMKERVEERGGLFTLESAPGQGTKILAVLPIRLL